MLKNRIHSLGLRTDLIKGMIRYAYLILLLLFAGIASAQTYYHIGFAERDITPNKPVVMAGFGTYVWKMRPRMSDLGIHDPIKTNAICISHQNDSPLVISSVDVIGLSAISIDRIRAQAEQALGQANMIVAATHNHQSPDTFGLWGPLPKTGRDLDYMKFMEQQVAKTIINACQKRQPAALKVAKTELNNTRFVFKAHDAKITSLQATALGGEVLGTLTQWSSSPSVLSKHNNTISADYIGAYRHFLNQRLTGTHVYVNGALGNVHGRPRPKQFADPFATGAQDPDIAKRYIKSANLGYVLAEEVLKALKHSQENIIVAPIIFKEKSFSMPLKSRFIRYLSELEIIENNIDNNTVNSRFVWLKLGQLQMVTVPGEMFPEGTFALRQQLASLAHAEHTMVIGLAQDWLGYFVPEDKYNDLDYFYYRLLSPHKNASPLMHQALTELLYRQL